MERDRVESAVATVPAGPWAVAVSGGADSVALLTALQTRADLRLHVVHLDHQTRGAASTGDAAFVADLARRSSLSCTIQRRDQIEPGLAVLPTNPSARFRAIRLELFRRAIAADQLNGVLLAHHLDDQAETVLQRLIRGASYSALAGMQPRTTVAGVTLVRPFLALRRAELREYLQSRGQPWREDASNESDQYLRNRLRRVLAESVDLFESLTTLSAACFALRGWTRAQAPALAPTVYAAELARLPRILADESVRCWLIDRGLPRDQVDSTALERVISMAIDAASPARQELPGGVMVYRRRGTIATERASA